MKKYKITIHEYSYETEAENEEEARQTAEEINWNRVDVEEVKPATREEIDKEATVIFELNGWEYAELFLKSKGFNKDEIEAFHEKVMKENDTQ